MAKSNFRLSSVLLAFLLNLFGMTNVSAEMVELKGKITQLSGALPATAILHSVADEGYSASALINKDSTFSFKVDEPRAGLYYLRISRSSFDVMLSAGEKTTNISIKFDGEALKDYQVGKSPENDAYRAFKTLINLYDAKLIPHFRYCVNEDTCEGELHRLLAEYAHALAVIRENFKGTYTADVLCRMKMPVVAKNVKNTSDEYRKDYFEKVDFSDPTIFSTPIFSEMIAGYVEFLIEPSISKENQFVKYFTDKIKANPVVLHKSAGLLFDDLYRAQREKMLAMFIAWYNTGDNKKAINNTVLDMRVKNVSIVMPGQPYIDITDRDPEGTMRSLKEVVDKSKCTLLLFWSSECSHCREEMPSIEQYYGKYHDKGLDIYAVSIESDSVKWKRFVKERKLPWTNVLADRSASSNPAVQYVTTSTPTMILIDSKGIILHRFIPKSKLEDRITEALK